MSTTKAAVATGASPSLPKSGAISKGYNFASTWEQNAPLTEQQQAAIVALSHAFAERPYPVKLSQERVHGQDNGLSISTKHCTVEESGAIEAVLVNTNQFYKWFTDLEAAMKSETEEKYQHYLTSLTERIQTCDGILHQVDETLDLFNELQLQHQAVATKTKTLHDACDRLLIEKQRLIEFAEALRSKLKYFDELENMKNGKEFFLTDTVGFIQKLPTTLVALPLGQPWRKFLSHPFWCMWWILAIHWQSNRLMLWTRF